MKLVTVLSLVLVGSSAFATPLIETESASTSLANEARKIAPSLKTEQIRAISDLRDRACAEYRSYKPCDSYKVKSCSEPSTRCSADKGKHYGICVDVTETFTPSQIHDASVAEITSHLEYRARDLTVTQLGRIVALIFSSCNSN